MRSFVKKMIILLFIIGAHTWARFGIAESGYDDSKNEPFFLVASRQVRDPRFFQSVILITNYDESGAVGFIINKATEIFLGIGISDKGDSEQAPVQLYFGGPVEPRTIVYLFRAAMASEETLHISGDIFLTSDAAHIKEQLKAADPNKTLRAFSGFAHWLPGQLEYEIENGAWYRTKVDEKILFQEDMSNLWQQMIVRFDGTLIET